MTATNFAPTQAPLTVADPAIEHIEGLIGHLRTLFTADASDWADVDLTIPQLRALALLQHQSGMTVGQFAIAMRMRMSSSSGSRAVVR